GFAAFSSTLTRTRITAGMANTRARRRPMVARRVIEATVLAWTENISWSFLPRAARSLLHQVGEHALQRLVLGQQLPELDALLPGQPGDLPAEGAVVRGLDLQPVPAHLHPGH